MIYNFSKMSKRRSRRRSMTRVPAKTVSHLPAAHFFGKDMNDWSTLTEAMDRL